MTSNRNPAIALQETLLATDKKSTFTQGGLSRRLKRGRAGVVAEWKKTRPHGDELESRTPP
jgi:hypothetical protein